MNWIEFYCEIPNYIYFTDSSLTTYSFDQGESCVLTQENFKIKIINDRVYYDDGREEIIDLDDNMIDLYTINQFCRLSGLVISSVKITGEF